MSKISLPSSFSTKTWLFIIDDEQSDDINREELMRIGKAAVEKVLDSTGPANAALYRQKKT